VTVAAPAPRRHGSAREYLEAIVIAALFLTFANTWVAQSFYIPSSSMEPTLLVGDHLFVNRFVFRGGGPLLPGRDVRRGDIVIFRSPVEPEKVLVKRCVALGGDVVDLRDKRLSVNGREVVEPYVVHRDPLVGIATTAAEGFVRRDQFGPYLVPPRHLFLMGDNRDQSLDARFWGPLPRHLVLGRAWLVYWSNGGVTPTGDERPLDRLVKLVQTATGFVTKTRWGRTGHLPR